MNLPLTGRRAVLTLSNPAGPAAELATATGRGVRIAVIDSGVYASHPHVQGVAGGCAIDAAGTVSDDYLDRVGHGTAVTAAIREKAPDAAVYAVRIFDRTLSTNLTTLTAGLRWAIDAGMHIINLSLGTANSAHAAALSAVVQHAAANGSLIVAARDDEGTHWLPGSLPGVVPVQVDWTCDRETFRLGTTADGLVLRTSGFPRPIPGVPRERNLSGISFAVANATALVARYLELHPAASVAEVLSGLAGVAPREAGAGHRLQ